jgi:3-hydroxymyristoyl/3-hydroxydecanoyl-(acyl carrier protein) dehydratase
VIRYDIHIDQLIRLGEIHLVRFRLVGTVNGEPFLTVTDGCAGFFSSAELASGQGVVRTGELSRRREGKRPADSDILPPVGRESYTEQQLDSLRAGDLAGCFGPLFVGLPLCNPLRIPSGRMRLVHRVTHLDPDGGQYGTGIIRAEADIRPDVWFLTCHFIDDHVMPGTLIYECCLQTLRIFLLRLGWVGEDPAVVCEPVPGVASRLKCRGQVTQATRTVAYEVTLKERGYRPEPYALCDALMYADGKPVVDITDLCLQMTGSSHEHLAAIWQAAAPRRRHESARSGPRKDPWPHS